MIFKNLWRRKTRTFLTSLGIAVGVAAVVALSAFGEGLASGFEESFASAEADITVSQKDALLAFISNVDAEVGDRLQSLPGVAEVAGTVIGVLQFPEAPYFIVKGEDPKGFAIAHYRLIEGSRITGRKQILLGKTTAKNFNKKVGGTFKINDVSYRIVGIYQTGVALEDGGAVMSLADAQTAFDKRDKVSYFNVKVKDPRRVDEIKKNIEASLPEVTATRSGEASKQSEILDVYRSFGWFLGVFAILVGGLGMMNTMVMSVLERTREIGVLRALGWRRRRVVGLILGESLVLALAGGILGLALGVGLTLLARLSPAVESVLGAVFTPTMFIQAMVVSLLLGTLGGLYPAWRASRLAPVEAMRYEGGSGGNLGRRTRALARLLGWGALRNLWRRPARTVVTVLGIGLGVGFVFALLSMMAGVEDTFVRLAGAGEADLMAEQAKASDISVSSIDERTVDRLLRQPEVKAVSRILLGIGTAPGLDFWMVLGLEPSEPFMQHYRVREGRMLQKSGEVILGRMAANIVKKGVGESLRIGASTYKIVGIYENGELYEDVSATMLLRDAQRLLGRQRQVTMLAINLHDRARAEEIGRALEKDFPELMITVPAKATERMQDFATADAMFNALMLLTVVVGGVVMMNAMLMSVFERTQEIGVLRALGWRRRRVLGMIIVESVGLGLLSSLAGVAIGFGLNLLFGLIPSYGRFLTPLYNVEQLIQVLVLAVALGVLGGFYPAWRAAGLRPIEALRYE